MTLPLRAAAPALLALACLAVPPGAPQAEAAAIVSRGALQTLLGGSGTLETFEAATIASGTQFTTGCVILTSSSTCNLQGPGLVGPDLTFGDTNAGNLTFNGANFRLASSQELMDMFRRSLTIDFATPVAAAGLDLRALFQFGATATLTAYAADDTTVLGSVSGIALSATGSPVFAGWADAAGIGKFVVTNVNALSVNWSAAIDNVEFGSPAPTPEPASAAALGLGLVALAGRRRARRRG